MKKTQITIDIELDDNHVPEKMTWNAEDGGVERVLGDPPLRMPLHAEQEALALVAEGLDQAIGRGRLDHQALGQPAHALAVQ